jgi:catechol-2,3-dioxygenase
LGWVRVRVPDGTAAASFWTRYVGLETVTEVDGVWYLRAGTEHHCVELVEDGSIDRAVTEGFGYVMPDRAALEALETRVGAAGMDTLALADSSAAYAMAGFGVRDVNGLVWEFVAEPHEFAEPPFQAFRPERLLHPFLVTPLYHPTVHLALDVFGFQPSDYITDITAFVRAENRYHHALAVLKGERLSIDHVNFLMPSLDHVMRGRARVLYEGVPVKMDLVKHSASGTIAFYFHDPRHGPPIELSNGHRVFTPEEHETHRPRRLAEGARNELDVWRCSDLDWREAGG